MTHLRSSLMIIDHPCRNKKRRGVGQEFRRWPKRASQAQTFTIRVGICQSIPLERRLGCPCHVFFTSAQVETKHWSKSTQNFYGPTCQGVEALIVEAHLMKVQPLQASVGCQGCGHNLLGTSNTVLGDRSDRGPFLVVCLSSTQEIDTYYIYIYSWMIQLDDIVRICCCNTMFNALEILSNFTAIYLSLGEKPNSILHPNHDANHHPNHVDIIFTSLWLVVSTLGKNPGHWELGRSPI